MKLGETRAADCPTTKGDQRFADLVKELTNGRIIIEVYPAKQLGEETTVIEQVQLGAVEFTRVSLSPTKPEDLKGLKIRVQESALMVGLVESFGEVYCCATCSTPVSAGRRKSPPRF